jgi:hypothetical protein
MSTSDEFVTLQIYTAATQLKEERARMNTRDVGEIPKDASSNSQLANQAAERLLEHYCRVPAGARVKKDSLANDDARAIQALNALVVDQLLPNASPAEKYAANDYMDYKTGAPLPGYTGVGFNKEMMENLKPADEWVLDGWLHASTIGGGVADSRPQPSQRVTSYDTITTDPDTKPPADHK